jgi:hypothetical protein
MRHSLYLVLVFFIFSVMIAPGCSQVQRKEKQPPGQ